MTREFVFIGEAPSATSNPRAPLSSPAVAAFLKEHFGFNGYSFGLKRNLLSRYPGRAKKGSLFPIDAARRGAKKIERDLAGRWELHSLIILGRRAARACGVGAKHPYFEMTTVFGCPAYVVPHPSGVNRFFNDAANRRKMATFGKRMRRWAAK